MQRGRPLDEEISDNILDIIRNKRIATPETIKNEYRKQFNRKISWATVRHHLNLMLLDKSINEEIITKGKKRMIAIYSLFSEYN